MSLSLMLVFQAVAQTPAAAPAPARLAALAAVDFDLARYRPADSDPWAPSRACFSDDPSAVIVCGRRRRGGAGAYPLDEMAREFELGPLVAEIRLFGNATGRFYVEGVELAPGMVSNRVMVGIRFPF